MGTIELFRNPIKSRIGPFWAFLAGYWSVFTLNVDLNEIKLNSIDVIFVKFKDILLVVGVKLKTVDSVPEIDIVFETAKEIDNKIEWAFLFANLWNEIHEFLNRSFLS